MNLTDEEVDARLNSPDNLLNLITPSAKQDEQAQPIATEIVYLPAHPVTKNDRIPPAIKETIAQIAETHTLEETADIVGISPATVSKIKKDPSVRERLDRKAEQAENKAIRATISALDTLMGKDLGDIKPKELSIIASNVASVVSKVRKPVAAGGDAVLLRVNIYAPNMKSERDFESFEVEGRKE